MNLTQLENQLKELTEKLNKEEFIYDLLLAYKLPKASIARLKNGNLNLAKTEGDIVWKKKLNFQVVTERDLHLAVSENWKSLKHNERFVVVTDFVKLVAIDTLTEDKLDIELKELHKHYDFFLPWAGMEKAKHAAENPADKKAAEKMARLFDELRKDNPDKSPEFLHQLNIFFSRLLFCYFAEDTHIFEENQFSLAIASHTKSDGSNTAEYLSRLFAVLNTPDKERNDLPKYLSDFPYVNGGLFAEQIICPQFSAKSRQLLIDNGDSNDWSAINPDIFGSMFQAVIDTEQRGSLGQHYTSVSNIMKVIGPLFLDELYETFNEAWNDRKKLMPLLRRIWKIKIFDPACGSGNFLIIAYKELRRLEMQIFKALGDIALSEIHLSNFYGIEIDDFAHEIAQLSLWLAEHQMNVEFFKEFGRTNPTLPLKEAGHITCANACRVDWETICPKKEGDEIYILGNPPYLGSSNQDKSQKADMTSVFAGWRNYKNLDYIACWFLKGRNYLVNAKAALAFVSTNSISQGEQVATFWPNILTDEVEIFFAHTSFKWQNNAKGNAGVSVAVIGLKNRQHITKKYLYTQGIRHWVVNINPYLTNAKNIYVVKRSKTLSELPEMTYGNKAVYGEPLILNNSEKEDLFRIAPESKSFIKKFIGAKELINGGNRWVIWPDNEQFEIANSIPEVNERFNKVAELRLESKDIGARELAIRSHQFRDTKTTKTNSVVIPLTSSERREYIPVDFTDSTSILSNAVSVIYDCNPWIFSILNSKMHIIWVKAVAGRLEDRIRYSSVICYNSFPFLNITSKTKDDLNICTFKIIEERQKYSDKNLAQLYDPDKMPEGLREAHRLNDLAVERCYRSTPFTSDEERLEYLFKLYEKMIAEEQERDTLFAKQKKIRKK